MTFDTYASLFLTKKNPKNEKTECNQETNNWIDASK